MSKQPDQAALIEVELLKEHAHNGEILTPGEKISVDASTVEYMVMHGIVANPRTEMPAEQQAGSFSTE
jgi:hypothetical protein